MFVDRSNPFACWWRVTNCFVNNLKRARERNRKYPWYPCSNGIRGSGGGFFGCLISEIVTRDGRMTRNPLDEMGLIELRLTKDLLSVQKSTVIEQ